MRRKKSKINIRLCLVGMLAVCLVICSNRYTQTEAATHTHTSACYNGATAHVHEGVRTKKAGCYQGSGSYANCGDYKVTKIGFNSLGDCDICNARYGGTGAEVYVSKVSVSCSNCNTAGTKYICDDCIYDYPVGASVEKHREYGYNLSCGKTAGTYYNSNGTVASVICNKKVTSIAPKNKSQTIIK